MVEVAFHPSASTEYRAGLAWYARHSRRAARGFEREVERVLSVMAGNPLRYPQSEAGCREAALVRNPYSMVFRIEPDGSLLVVAVAHASREPGYWLTRASP